VHSSLNPKLLNHPGIKVPCKVLNLTREGKLSVIDVGVYCAILSDCNTETGRWLGNASRLSTIAPSVNSSTRRNYQRSLLNLENIGLIRTFEKVEGSNIPWKVLIEGYTPSAGEHAGKRLNAAASLDWENPLFERVE
jgi:hypothetical protein